MKEGVLGERKMEGKKGKKPEEKMEGGRLLLGNKGGKMRENEGELGSSGRGAVDKLSQKKGGKMATQSGGSPAILALGNGGDDQKKFKKLQLSIWGAGQKKNRRGKKIIKKPNRGNRVWLGRGVMGG